jgi:hypothetical protein
LGRGGGGSDNDVSDQRKSVGSLVKIFQECTMSQNDINFSFDRFCILGHGVYGSVYKGNFEGNTVAVKRTPLNHGSNLVTKDEFLKSIRHSNLVGILQITKDDDFRQVHFHSFY